MKKMSMTSMFAVLLTTSLLGACSDRTERKAEEARDEAAAAARKSGDAAESASRDAGGAIRQAGSSASEATREAASAVGGAVANAGRAADAAVETLDVKTALIADSRIDASNVNVDTDHVKKVVVLKGRVPTAAQRTTAGEIATAKAVGYRVQNDLAIGR